MRRLCLPLSSALGAVMQRATFDESVIQEWEKRCAAYKKSAKLVEWGTGLLFIALSLPPIFSWVEPFPYFGFTAFLATFCFLYLRTRHQLVLCCPNCNSHPAPVHGQLPIQKLDWCPHCGYWLISPRGKHIGT
jgi:hypothetical protein